MGEHELLLPLVDEENACLPLPVNVVSRYWNVALPLAEAAEAAKRYAGFGGSILIEGIESAERHGLECRVARPAFGDLKKAIEAGIPPIVILPGIPEITQHASVITGYSDEENTVLHYVQESRDGEQQEGAIPQDAFEREWSEESNMAMLIAPPDVMQASPIPGSRSDRLCFEAERQAILGDAQGAMGTLGQAASLDPGNPVAHGMLGGLLNEQGSQDCAAHYEKSINTNPRAYLAHNGLGNFYLKSGRLEDAEACYTRAIGINPRRSARIYKNRAYLLDKLGRADEAREDLRAYLRHFPRASDRGAIEQAIREL